MYMRMNAMDILDDEDDQIAAELDQWPVDDGPSFRCIIDKGLSGGRSVWEETMEEDIKVAGEHAVETVKNLIKEGNVRRIKVKNGAGETILSIPLTVGVVGGVVGVAAAPVLAVIGAVAGLMSECTISVEREV